MIWLLAVGACGTSPKKANKGHPKNGRGPHVAKKIPKKPAMTIKDLLKTTVTIKGSWVESDVFVDDRHSWHCSGVVRRHKSEQLEIVTNKHCTGLYTLAVADAMGAPDVKKWSITIHTHNDRTFVAQSIAVAKNVDLAIITTAKGRFKAGRDFLLPPPFATPEVGDEVLAIGSPVDPKYSGTVTFGRVSAIRERFIQHDAALNPGNSGGPLYAKTSGGDYALVGINTYKLIGNKWKGINLEGLSFSISIKEVSSGVFISAPVDKSGACLLIRGLTGKGCNVK
ncbi:S1C family serine protease [Myxococcota bacterium]|nr:S1C family serine protease [Myxococcota bacterium]MBU1534729.1 S1C family serine protease [Myxococcota bacterium]